MRFTNMLTWAPLALLSATAYAAPAARQAADQCCTLDKPPSREYKEKMMNDYLAIWAGDLSLAESTLSPNVVVWTDRHPTGNESWPVVVSNIPQFLDFVNWARTGWDDFRFVMTKWMTEDYNIAIRWKFLGTMGGNFTLSPTTKKQGELVTNNGTDFVVLNPCTGLIDELNIAQDSIEFLWSLGVGGIMI